MEVFLSEKAEAKLLQLNGYLLANWNVKAKNDFIDKLTKSIELISKFPESCPVSNDFEDLYKCVVSKQTTLYYRILWDRKEIEIITIFDTRQNFDNLKKEI